MPSLQEKVAAGLKAREESGEKTIVLPVPGHESYLAAEYRKLDLPEAFDIKERYAGEETGIDAQLAVRAATLVRACVRLLEVKGEDEYGQIDGGWTVATLRDHLGITVRGDATPYDVLSAVLNGREGDEDIYFLFERYSQKASERDAADREHIRGNSEASSAEAEQSISR